MAKLLRGRNAGTEVELVQASNDWVMVDLPGGKSTIMNPTSIGFELDEDRSVVLNAGGHFWALYEWTSEAQVRLKRKDAHVT